MGNISDLFLLCDKRYDTEMRFLNILLIQEANL